MNYTQGYLINYDHFIEIENINYNYIDRNIYQQLFDSKNINVINSCILIKYYYNQVKYRLYINYNDIDNKKIELPLDIESIKNLNVSCYSKNIINMLDCECDKIEYARINDIDVKEIIEECNGPFNDFGLLNNNKIYIKYLTRELDLNNIFINLNIKYINFHFDEQEMELKEHFISINTENDYINSPILNKILNLAD